MDESSEIAQPICTMHLNEIVSRVASERWKGRELEDLTKHIFKAR